MTHYIKSYKIYTGRTYLYHHLEAWNRPTETILVTSNPYLLSSGGLTVTPREEKQGSNAASIPTPDIKRFYTGMM